MTKAILYEVYSKRALHEPIDQLVVLDRERNRKRAVVSARRWGACVVRVECRILTRYPLTREVISWEVVWVHKPRRPGNQDRNVLTRRQLIGKLRANSKSLYRGFRR